MLIEPAIYLPRLIQEVREAGDSIVEREMRSIGDIQAPIDPVIFNCIWLGARTLFTDDALTPVRGQLVFMPPDERADYITRDSGEGLLWRFPRTEGILLGGPFERSAARHEPDADTNARIVRERARMFQAMRT